MRTTDFSQHHTEGTPSFVTYLHVKPVENIRRYSPVLFTASGRNLSVGETLKVAQSGDRVAGVADMDLHKGVDGVVAISGMITLILLDTEETKRFQLHDYIYLKHCISGLNDAEKNLPVGTFLRYADPIFMEDSTQITVARVMLCPWMHCQKKEDNLDQTLDKVKDILLGLNGEANPPDSWEKLFNYIDEKVRE